MAPIRVVNHMRNVIVNQKSGESNALERSHRLDRVNVAFSDEAFLEFGHRPLNVPKMNVEDLSTRTEVLDRLDDAFAHLGPAAHAEIETVIWARGDFQDSPSKTFEVAE